MPKSKQALTGPKVKSIYIYRGYHPSRTSPMSKTVIEEIADERRRQIDVEGWTVEHDDEHELGEMAVAAACYAIRSTENYDGLDQDDPDELTPPAWPWDWQWWKPKSPRRDLIRAAALIVAEIERLDREGA